jgi:hypothetical protein
MRYHICIGFPKTIILPEKEMHVIYTNHALKQMQKRGIKKSYPSLKIQPQEVIEVRTKDNVNCTSLLIRKELNEKTDIVISVKINSPNTCTIITMWKNNKEDHHNELNEKLYDLPDNYNSREIDFIYAGI